MGIEIIDFFGTYWHELFTGLLAICLGLVEWKNRRKSTKIGKYRVRSQYGKLYKDVIDTQNKLLELASKYLEKDIVEFVDDFKIPEPPGWLIDKEVFEKTKIVELEEKLSDLSHLNAAGLIKIQNINFNKKTKLLPQFKSDQKN